MSAPTPAARRLRAGAAALAAALVLAGLGAASVWREARLGVEVDVSGPVLPGWTAQADAVASVEIASAEARLRLSRAEAGWTMPSRGDYPIPPERIAALDEGLRTLVFERAMTRDPEKFDRLGLGAPGEGGAGVRVTLVDSEEEVLASLIVGAAHEDGEGLYVRRVGGRRAYAARGALPEELASVSAWLGLDFWDLDGARVARAAIQPESGPAWRIERPGLSARNAELREPQDWRLVTAGAGNGVAAAGLRLRFRDVKPEAALTGAFVARHSAVTFSGLAYRFDFHAEGEARWVTIEVEAAADDAQPRAERLQAQVEGWAFLTSPDAYERLARPLSGVAERSP